MPNVLILGGSGYLGTAIAQALLRSGNYQVWGTARSAAKAAQLRASEVFPVETVNVEDPKTITQAIDAHHIDAVIDATSAYENAASILSAVVSAAKARIDALAKGKAVGPKLAFVYTSGSFVHGSPSHRINDLTVPDTPLAADKPATAVAWRPGHEQAILQARDVLEVAILRPAAIYGRGSWVWGTYWGPLLAAAQSGSKDPVQIPALETTRTGVVHVDDLAEAYRGALDRIHGQLGSWPVFDVGTENLSIVDFVESAKTALGVKAKVQYAGTYGNAFLEALALVVNTDYSRAKFVIGWTPKRVDFVPNIAVYVNAWKATEEMKPKA